MFGYFTRWWQFKYVLFSPLKLGKFSNLTIIFFRWVQNHQLEEFRAGILWVTGNIKKGSYSLGWYFVGDSSEFSRNARLIQDYIWPKCSYCLSTTSLLVVPTSNMVVNQMVICPWFIFDSWWGFQDVVADCLCYSVISHLQMFPCWTQKWRLY